MTNTNYLYEEFKSTATKYQALASNPKNPVFLVTGASGLIGKATVLALLKLFETAQQSGAVIAQGRNIEKLRLVFNDFLNHPNLILWQANLNEKLAPPLAVDFIIHTASPTASKEFIEKPIEVIDSIYNGTKNILDLCFEQQSKSCVYLSSMEVYGQVLNEQKISEPDLGYLDCLSLRSSYPEGKRLAELMCTSYAKKKNVPVKIARLSMIFGPGVDINDRRVLNYFTQQISTNSAIRLQTKGTSKACVLYIKDAIEGILHLLLQGENGEAYNLANPSNYYSIREMAEIAVSMGAAAVHFPEEVVDAKQYPKDTFLNLDISKIQALGWKPEVCLKEIFKHTLASWK